jgi:hypothetical protein
MRLYHTSVGIMSGLLLFRLVAFWVRSAMGWSVPFSLGELLVEGPLLAVLILPTFGGHGNEAFCGRLESQRSLVFD